MLLRARWVVPVAAEPIPDGALCVRDGRIQSVGRWRDLRHLPVTAREDLGEVIVCPGLVNAHCHLDYTGLAGHLPPQASFTAWIQSIKGAKGLQSPEDVREAWRVGAAMLLRNGVTTVGDIEAFPELQPSLVRETGLRVVSFLELIRIRADAPVEDAVDQGGKWLRDLGEAGLRAGLSPHAPYSTTPLLRRRCAELAVRCGAPVSMHLAESAEEFEMFMAGEGALLEWLARNGRAVDDCGGRSPVQVAADAGLLGPRFLAVHVNYLAPGDAERLAGAGASVAHCPRSHAYFRHQPFPWEELRAAGVNVCLATDSLATVRTTRRRALQLDLFAEARRFRTAHPGVALAELLGMVTRHPAAALGMTGEVGILAAGACADLIAVPSAAQSGSPLEGLFEAAGPSLGTMVGGRWVSRREGS